MIQEYLNKIQDNQDVYPHPVQSPAPSYGDAENLCQSGMKWNPQLQRCVPLGDGENTDYTGE